jgi:hypothetical protein
MVDREDHGMVAPPHRTSPIVRPPPPPLGHDGRAHANPHSAHRAIGTNDHPAHPVTPSTFETPSITRVRNCFLSAGRGTQTHRLPCYPGSPPVRRRGGEPGHTHRTLVDQTYERSRPDQRNLTMAPPVAWHCLEPSEWTIARRSSMLRPHAHPSLYSASPLGVLGM